MYDYYKHLSQSDLRNLLETHTHNLATLMQEAAKYGASAIPSALQYQINDERESIETIQRILGGQLRHAHAPHPHSHVQHFIATLRSNLIREKELYDLSRNEAYAAFDLIGYRVSMLTVDLIAYVKADALSEAKIVDLRNRFFEITRDMPRDFGLKPRGRNPNGLFGLIFEQGCPAQFRNFIQKQTKIAHAVKGGIVVSWVLDLKQREIHTHHNPVSLFPPVWVVAGIVYPGLAYLKDLVQNAPQPPSK